MPNYKPLGDNLIVEPDKHEEQTVGGLIIPETAESAEKITRGTVVAVGEGVDEIEAGDVIIYNQFGGVEYDLGDETLLVMTKHDVVVVEA